MRILKILLILIFAFNRSHAQSAYLNEIDNSIYRINSDFSLTSVISVNDSSLFLADIALSPSNVFYAIFSNKIYAIDSLGNATILTTLPDLGFYSSLTCSNDYELYTICNDFNDAANSKLYKYNIVTNTISLVTNIGFSTPGDLTFYKGNLVFAALGTNKIKAYNLQNNTVVDIFCLPQQYESIFGIAGIYTSCDSTIILCCTQTSILKLDILSNTVTNLQTNSSYYLGMTSDNEFLSSDCSYQFAPADCALSIPTFSQASEDLVFPNPFYETLHFKNHEEINTLELSDINGRILLKISSPSSEISLGHLEKGIYFLRLSTDKGSKMNKLIKL